jgi:endoglucanase
MTRKIRIAIGVTIFTLGILPLAILLLAHTQSPVEREKKVPLTGVNIAGADFGAGQLPGIFGKDYVYPEPTSIDYYAAKGMNIIRLPVLWERLQHHLGENLDESEMQRIDGVVTYATSKGLKISIDVH